MDILISDNWLRDFLKTKATPEKIAECLSLCGPSAERLTKVGKDTVYSIEVTTNRVDSASVLGIAREAAAILPRFGVKAKLTLEPTSKPQAPVKSLPLYIKTDAKLVKRVMAVVFEDIRTWTTPVWLKNRLEASGVRSLNLVVDITNYIMLETGHPTHVFDYDLIKKHKLVFRESKRGEKIVSFDNKIYKLLGGDIVIDNGAGEIIDLPGIVGTKNSVVNKNTKRIIFFIDNNDPRKIRNTSMNLGTRTYAATLNEKGVDPELAKTAFLRGAWLYQKLCHAKVASKLYDIYPSVYKSRVIKCKLDFISERLGVKIDKSTVELILSSLGFRTICTGGVVTVFVPSCRANDIQIPEDIVEEVARIYGYHNLPSILPEGQIPDKPEDTPFEFEEKIKNILRGFGGVEVYTHSLVSKDMVKNALKLKNPLGTDSEYLRTSLKPSLIKAVKENSHEQNPFHLFEMANVYTHRKNDLPRETMTLAGITKDFPYRKAKGAVEALFESLKINTKIGNIGTFTKLLPNLCYYEFSVETLKQNASLYKKFSPIPQYPPQIEDMTLVLPQKTSVGDVIDNIKKHKVATQVELEDTFKDTITLRVFYQDPEKTLTNRQVEKARNKIMNSLQEKFGVSVK